MESQSSSIRSRLSIDFYQHSWEDYDMTPANGESPLDPSLTLLRVESIDPTPQNPFLLFGDGFDEDYEDDFDEDEDYEDLDDEEFEENDEDFDEDEEEDFDEDLEEDFDEDSNEEGEDYDYEDDLDYDDFDE